MMPFYNSVIRAFFLALLLYPTVSHSIVALRPELEIEGFLKIQNVLRTPNFSDAEFIMQRNTAQLEGKWYFLREGEALGRFATGPIEEATLTFIGRGVYDSIYDIRDSFRDKFTDEERENRKFEYKLREIYTDLLIPPVTLRLGRQQVVWGETDQFRALDVINPLDGRWHWFFQESFEDIRIPVWMARTIYDIGKLGPVEESFVETIWIPGDFQRNKLSTDPRRPWGFFGSGLPQQANTVLTPDGQVLDLITKIGDRKPDAALESSELGTRFKGVWQGIDFSLNYFWTIADDPGVKVRQDRAAFGPPSRSDSDGTLTLPIELVHSRSHVIGVSANYAEDLWTQSVFRVEASYTTGLPVTLQAGTPRRLDPDQNNFQTTERTLFMLAFDRQSWIRPLNPQRTFFITGQFFWQHYTDYHRFFRGAPSVRRAIRADEILSNRFIGVNTDRITEDEIVMTLAASTAYGPAGLWQPLAVVGYDPVATSFLGRLALDYLFSNHLIFRISSDFFWGKSYEGPWFLGDRFGRSRDSRHETQFNIIFQF